MLKQISPLPGQTWTVEGWAKPVGPEVMVAASDREEVLSASVWMQGWADQGLETKGHLVSIETLISRMCFFQFLLGSCWCSNTQLSLIITVHTIKQGWHWKVVTFFSLYMLVQWFFWMLSSIYMQGFCPTNTYRSISAFVLAICVCQNKRTCSFAFQSVTVSVFILGIYFYLKFYYLSLQISIFKS